MKDYKFSFGDACRGPFGAYITLAAKTEEEATAKLKGVMEEMVNSYFTNKRFPYDLQLHFNHAALRPGHIESVFDHKGWIEVPIGAEAPRFVCIECSSFFEVYDTQSGRRASMGDGVDTLFSEEDTAFRPGTPGFVDLWTASLNQDPQETLEAYFPEIFEMEIAAEDAEEPCRVFATRDGSPMTFERRVDGVYGQLDGDLVYDTYDELVEAKRHWEQAG